MREAMDWSDVKIFLAIVRAGSLGGAARLTGQSQPTVGRRLKALERQVGQALFQRGREGFVLTTEGASVVAHAERMEEEAMAIERQLAGQDRQLEGVIRVSASDWFGAHILTPIFGVFLQQHPGVAIELITDARIFSLARREADLAFRIRPFDEADVVQRKATHVRYRVYRARGSAGPILADGSGVSLITLDAAFQDFPDATWLRRMLPGARVAFGSNSRDAQARMCASGAGLAVLPAPLGDAFPGLVAVDLGEAPPGRDVWVGYHRDLRRLARLRALVDMTIEQLGH
jgi:DNA-binding transcriptional LysR family regulator